MAGPQNYTCASPPFVDALARPTKSNLAPTTPGSLHTVQHRGQDSGESFFAFDARRATTDALVTQIRPTGTDPALLQPANTQRTNTVQGPSSSDRSKRLLGQLMSGYVPVAPFCSSIVHQEKGHQLIHLSCLFDFIRDRSLPFGPLKIV